MKIMTVSLIVNILLFTQISWCKNNNQKKTTRPRYTNQNSTRNPEDLKAIQKLFADLNQRLHSTYSELFTIKHLHEIDAELLSDDDLQKLKKEPLVQKQYDSIRSELKIFIHFFYGKNFDRSSCPFEDLSTIRLKHVSLKNSYMLRTKLAQTDFSHSDFTNSTLIQADFCNAKLKNTIFKKADLSEAKFTETNLEGALFFQADLSYAKFVQSNLSQAILEQCNAINTNFWGTNLQNANLIAINAEHAEFCLSSLENAFLLNGNFKNSAFDNANLTGANLCGANFENAIFDSADMSKVKFTAGSKKHLTMLCNVKNANFIRVKGLTPKQKLFLVQNGAINIPQ